MGHCIVAAMKTGIKRLLKEARAMINALKCSFAVQLCEDIGVQGERRMSEIAVSWWVLLAGPDRILKRVPVGNGQLFEKRVQSF